MIATVFKVLKRTFFTIKINYNKLYCRYLFIVNDVTFGSFSCYGKPFINIALKGSFTVGNSFHMNNGVKYTMIGNNGKCRIGVFKNANLIIGNNVGMSDVTISCWKSIIIEDNVLIGSGTQIRDSDGHSLDKYMRMNPNTDDQFKINKEVIIRKNVFIGAGCYILKGVEIGENSIIGVGSVVTKSVPSNEIWAGNPAKFIKKIPSLN
jgi:acetyltransferase-like isoleucine patch superfamily enzyme